MKILRWILLILYIAIVVGLLAMAYNKGDTPNESLFLLIFMLVITVIAQTIFILGAGTSSLCAPIRKRRLVIPVTIAAVMMTTLVAGILLAITELLFPEGPVEEGEISEYIFWIIVGLNWLTWSIIFFIRGMKTERYKTLRNMISAMFAGSLLSLMISIPSHIIVSRRPGCMVGFGTALGIISGIFVMFWAFGPGIILLFLREKRKV